MSKIQHIKRVGTMHLNVANIHEYFILKMRIDFSTSKYLNNAINSLLLQEFFLWSFGLIFSTKKYFNKA